MTERGKLSGLLEEDQWLFVLVDRLLFFSLYHKEGITLGAVEEIDEVAGGASGMGVDRIGKVDDKASEGEPTGVFYSGVSGRDRSRGGTRGTGNKVSADKELTEVGKMAGGD